MGQAKRRKAVDPNYGKVSNTYKKPPYAQLQLMSNVERGIQDPGWQNIAVGSDSINPGFVYTVGLKHSFSHPELVTVGITPKSASIVFNLVGEFIKDGNKIQVDQIYTQFGRVPMIFKEIKSQYKEHYFGTAIAYYGSVDAFEALQMVWSDEEGTFPWEDSCDIQVKYIQPTLY